MHLSLSSLLSRRTRPAIAAVALAIAGGTLSGSPISCKPAAGPPSQVLKSIEERRARAVIEQVITRQGSQPNSGRSVQLKGDVTLVEELALQGTDYGIAYVTAVEAEKLGDAVPRYNPDSQQLRLVRGQQKEIVLVLYEQAYKYDAGQAHSTTAVTAERKLQRDVEDFIMHVVKQGKGK